MKGELKDEALAQHRDVREALGDFYKCEEMNNKLYCEVNGEWVGFTRSMQSVKLGVGGSPTDSFFNTIEKAKKNTEMNKKIGAFPDKLEE